LKREVEDEEIDRENRDKEGAREVQGRTKWKRGARK